MHTDNALEKQMISISESDSVSDSESEEFSLSECHTSEVSMHSKSEEVSLGGGDIPLVGEVSS